MAQLVCTIEEYNKFIGPRIRNSIQSLTKKRKKELNSICQMCKKNKELEAAHKKGMNRKLIIENTLKEYIYKGEKFKIDLQKLEQKIIIAHKPIDKYFKFLCHKCHKKYDEK